MLRITINLLHKGRKEQIKSHAEDRGESVNVFINHAINETIARDNNDTNT